MVITDTKIIDEEKRIVQFEMVPDPRIWEKIEIDGKKYYHNKVEDVSMSEDDLMDAIPQLKGKPIYFEDLGFVRKDYLKKSKKRIEGIE